MDATEYLYTEKHFLPWISTARQMGYYDLQLSREPFYGNLQRYWRSKLDPIYFEMIEREGRIVDVQER